MFKHYLLKLIYMKSKKLIFSTLLAFGCMVTYLTMTSSSSGQMGVASTGCGGNNCHGNAQNPATTIAVTGIPAGGYVAGTTYPITLTISNATASLTKAGFDLNFSGGSISGAPANTMIMGTELHHTSPFNLTAGTVNINFNWTAPAAGGVVTLNVSANAVNNNNATSGDQWNKVNLTFVQATPTAVKDLNQVEVSVYPNPANEFVTVKTEATVHSFKAVSMTGSIINLNSIQDANNQYRINTQTLSSGNYILLMNDGNKNLHTIFTKK
jgi:hypothetical protein